MSPLDNFKAGPDSQNLPPGFLPDYAYSHLEFGSGANSDTLAHEYLDPTPSLGLESIFGEVTGDRLLFRDPPPL